MRIPLVFLVVCVVASFALPQRNNSVNTIEQQQREEKSERKELENNISESAVVDDHLIGVGDENLDEKINSSNDTVTDRCKCRNRIWRRHNRRYWLRPEEQRRRDRSGTELIDQERKDPYVWQETLFPYVITDTEVEHHRHHHHHHKNRTTTTTPRPQTTTSTTLTSGRQLSELEEIAMYRRLTPN